MAGVEVEGAVVVVVVCGGVVVVATVVAAVVVVVDDVVVDTINVIKTFSQVSQKCFKKYYIPNTRMQILTYGTKRNNYS